MTDIIISKIYIDKEVKDYPQTSNILNKFSNIENQIIDSNELYKIISKSKNPVDYGKKILFLTKNNGLFIKKCPGTKYYTCCGYYILHIGTYCFLDCSYCILQSYFHPPVLQLFLNHNKLFSELNNMFENKTIHRIGTGEFTDSLIWEDIFDFSSLLVPVFSNQNSCVLELKTKTTNIDHLKDIKHNRKTIISWSLNTPYIIKTQERRTSSLTERLKAAKICENLGYPLAFHFDPIILYEGCENEYKEVIENLFSYVSSKNIVWISLGTFRYMPSLKKIIQHRFKKSKIIYDEFIIGFDKKMRYFKPLRIKIYKEIVNRIKEIAPDVIVYYCMEDDVVWKETMGYLPQDKMGLEKILDLSASEKCEILL